MTRRPAPPPRSTPRATHAAAAAALILLASLPLPLAAQTVELGVVTGLAHSTVAWETTPLGSGFEELERRTAFTGGVSLGLHLTERLALRAQLLHTGKGFREVQANGDDTALDLTYLELPLLLGVRFPSGGPLEPELYAGPYLARELGCEASGIVDGQDLSFDCDEVPGDDIPRRTTDWGGVAGVALRVGNGARPHLVFDVRYTRGLRNVDAAPEVDNFDIRHRGLAAMVGLSLPLGR